MPAEFDWSPSIKGLILSSFFYGYIVTQLPAGYLAAKYGGRRIFGIGVAASSLLTILTPIFARTSLYLLLAARVMEGLFEGVVYPAIHAVWARWAPPLERSKLATIAFSGSYFGTVVALPLSGFLAETLGWPSIFVFFGKFKMLLRGKVIKICVKVLWLRFGQLLGRLLWLKRLPLTFTSPVKSWNTFRLLSDPLRTTWRW